MGLLSLVKKMKSNSIRSLIQYCIYYPIRLFFLACRIFPIKQTRVVFSNFNGKGYGCNPKYIAEKLLEKQDLELVWLVKKNVSPDFPKGIKRVNILSLRAWYYMATAKIWVSNNRQPLYVMKRKKQYYVQTYHGCLPMKKVEKDINMPMFYKSQSKHDSKMANLLIVNSDCSYEIYNSCFWYSGEYYKGGAPRNDIIVNKSAHIVSKVKKALNIEDNSHIVLYAPTFRNSENLTPYSIDFESVTLALEKRFGGKWTFVIRLHPVLFGKSFIDKQNKYIIDATNYPDIQELLSVADVCITDYSSCILDYMVKKTPGFIFATDYESYVEERGFYFDPRELPFPYAETSAELVSLILSFKKEKYESDITFFFKRIGLTESGNASVDLAERIYSVIRGQ